LDSILCLVVPEHGSNSSCTSRTKLRLMPAYLEILWHSNPFQIWSLYLQVTQQIFQE
jgi:hypothetical protein